LGYGVVGTQLLLHLSALGVDIKLWPMGNIDCHPNHVALIQAAVDARHEYDVKAPCLKVWHQHDLAQQVGRGPHMGFPIFELNQFTDVERAEVQRMDRVFVCSEWAKDIVLDQCSFPKADSVIVAPLGVDRQTFGVRMGADSPDPEWTTFLNVGKWELRKGHDLIAEAFAKAFKPNDKVRLRMMNHNPFISKQQNDEWESLYKLSSMGHRVEFLPRVSTHAEVADIMSKVDCGVFPARAEGWNLELLEMMSMGKHVITTDYSAHTEFCDSNNAMLLDVDELETAHDGVFFTQGRGEWAKLGDETVDQMVEYMREVHKGGKGINIHGIETAQRLSWENTAKIIVDFGLTNPV
jgi:glycosyltransferase involved in cell wall biosynthesis